MDTTQSMVDKRRQSDQKFQTSKKEQKRGSKKTLSFIDLSKDEKLHTQFIE